MFENGLPKKVYICAGKILTTIIDKLINKTNLWISLM